MNVLLLLPAVLIAALLFGACLWSAAQAIRRAGTLRAAHAAALALTLAGIASISWNLAAPAQILGMLLGAASLIAIWTENGWSRLIPAPQFVLALVLIFRIPFITHG